MTTINNIRNLMKPLQSPAHPHTALIDGTGSRTDIGLAVLRWAGGATQKTLTKFELPPDAVGRIYVVDVFIGEVVDTKYADWAKHVRRGKYDYSDTSNVKGAYISFPQVQFDYLDGVTKRRHYRPMLHSIIAYVVPELREQFAQAALLDMQARNRSFIEAQVQVNHMDKDTKNNSVYNLEVTTATENNHHRFKTSEGLPHSMVCARPEDTVDPDLLDYDLCGITDARREYIDKLCRHLSAASISTDADTIEVLTASGDRISIYIKGLSAWGILASLFTSQATAVLRTYW